MIAVDAGILVLAANRHAPGHVRAAELLESLANGEAPWALPWPAVHEFLGFVTHPHAVARVLSAQGAWAFIATLAEAPVMRFVGPTARHAETCSEVLALADDAAAAGLDPSFATAVVLREHGIREVRSTDPGLKRWRFLDVRDPIGGAPWTPAETPRRRYRMLTRRARPA